MALSKLNSMWNLISDNTFVVPLEFTSVDLFCVICKKIVIDAFVSGVCGCQYCHKCIREYVNNEEKYCPGGKEDCNDDFLSLGGNVMRNNMLNKRITKLKVKCLNQSCTCNIELIKMEEHLRLCKKQAMDCPYVSIGCNIDKVDRDTIESHLHTEAVTHSELLIELIGNLRNEVNVLRDDSENRKMEINDLREELRINKNKIAALEEDLRNVQNEMEQRVNEKIRIEEDALIERDAVATMVTDLRKDVDGMMAWKNKCEEEREEEFDKCDKLCQNIVGDFRWKLDQLSTKIDKYLYSKSFYSNNYKFCLHMYINNCDNIYLYCHIMKGDNDDIVEWPMRREVTLSIVDQVTMSAHTTRTYNYDTFEYKSAFDRPTKDMNDCGIGSYWPLSFIEYSSIKEKSWIVAKDSIVVSCAVSDK